MQDEHQGGGKRSRRLIAAAIGAAAVLAAGAGAAGALHVSHAGEVLPGVSLAGVDLGGVDAAELRQRVQPILASQQAAPVVVFTLGASHYRVTAQQVGHATEIDATVEQVLAAGRGGSALEQRWGDLSSLWRDRPIRVADSVDDAALTSAIAQIAAEVDQPARPAGIEVSADARVVAVSPRPGRLVDQPAAAALVRTGLREPGVPVPLPLRPPPPQVDGAAVRAVVEQARALLARPVMLRGDGFAATLPAAKLAPALRSEVVAETGRAALRLAFDERALHKAVDLATDGVETDPVDGTLTIKGKKPRVDSYGDVTWRPRPASVRVSGTRPGRRVDVQATTTSLLAALRAGERSAPLAVVPVPSPLSASGLRGVDALIGTFTSYHSPGAPRVTNIHRIADLVDGTVIRPGDEFSLNGLVGERTRAKGFVADSAIMDGKLVKRVGGGVSQFATATFNAAFFAGLPIEEHKPHSFYISRYPPGRESTVSYPEIDVRWTNDTTTPIVVDTSHTDSSITVSLYGDNGDRRVSALTGARDDFSPGGGFSIAVTRVVAGGEGTDDRRVFATRYDDAPEDE